MRKSVYENIFKLLLFENVILSVHKTIRVKTFIIDADLLELFFIKIKLDVFSVLESLVTNWAASILYQPPVNAVFVVNVKTAEHSTDTIVFDAFKANYTILNKIFACLHSNQSNFYILIQLFQKVVTNRESSSLDANFINTISLSITIYPLVKDLVPILVLRNIIMLLTHLMN